MPDIVTVRCPVCGFIWEEDLDWHRDHETLHAAEAGSAGRKGRGKFRFKCPQDGTWVTVERAANLQGALGSGHSGSD
jgi:hypothetical protein